MTDQRIKLAAERFHAKYVRGELDECWEWQAGRKNSYGNGGFYFEGKEWLAHRFSWTLANGQIPEGMTICHSCDNPKCVNPAHLWLGTQLDNIRDRDQKGRFRPHSKEQYRAMQQRAVVARQANGNYKILHRKNR